MVSSSPRETISKILSVSSNLMKTPSTKQAAGVTSHIWFLMPHYSKPSFVKDLRPFKRSSKTKTKKL
jgi:hypothetical protein